MKFGTLTEPYDTSLFTKGESSTLASILAGSNSVEHWRDADNVTGLRFVRPECDIWVWPSGDRFAFWVDPKTKEQNS